MILIDTNVLIYASSPSAQHHDWAMLTIADAVSSEGAAANAVCIAEICVGDAHPELVAAHIRSWGVHIVDIPAAAAESCAAAYRTYRRRRMEQSGKSAPSVPLPDFFIGAHAEIMGWTLATADPLRIKTYWPKVRLLTP